MNQRTLLNRGFRQAATAPPLAVAESHIAWQPRGGGAAVSATPVSDSDNELMLETVRRRISTKRFSLIEIPANILRIISVMTDPDFSYAAISGLVANSPVLTAEILRTANSVAYSRGTAMNDVRVVLPRLGQKRIRSILYLHSLKLGLANHPLFRDVATEIVEHSVRVASLGSRIAGRCSVDRDRAYQAGILHDIGKLAILRDLAQARVAPRKLRPPVTESSFGRVLPELHQQVGETLALSWDMEPAIAFAIGHHHDVSLDVEPDDHDDALLAALVGFADAMARSTAAGGQFNPAEMLELPAASRLGLADTPSIVTFLDDLAASSR